MKIINDQKYFEVLNQIKEQISTSQHKAMVTINSQLIIMYYKIGPKIDEMNNWGSKIIDNLAKDLKLSYPNITGFSTRNLKYMQTFYREYPNFEFVQGVLAQIPWWSNLTLLDKIKNNDERIWYANKAKENGWSRNVLVHQIAMALYQRQADDSKKITNYSETLPIEVNEQVLEMFKDPYIFSFIDANDRIIEKKVEDLLVNNIIKLLLELGEGFAFVGRQYKLTIDGDEFFIDLLFYNVILRCYIVVELKTGKFIPEYAGKLNFYLTAVDNILKKEQDNPTIGILLCKDKNKLIAEYALKDVNKPIGVAEYKYFNEIPEYLENNLPSIEEIKTRLKLIKK